jgi:hypothetical protein
MARRISVISVIRMRWARGVVTPVGVLGYSFLARVPTGQPATPEFAVRTIALEQAVSRAAGPLPRAPRCLTAYVTATVWSAVH